MKDSLKTTLKDLASITLLTALLLSLIISLTSSQTNPLPWAEQMLTLRQNLKLTPQQDQLLGSILLKREKSLRHLKKQMLTTLTPEQRNKANQIWSSRRARTLQPQERISLRKQLGISKAQVAQFNAYHSKIKSFKKELTNEVAASLTPSQQPRFEELALEF